MDPVLAAIDPSKFAIRPSQCAQACRQMLIVLGPVAVIEIGTAYGAGVSHFGPLAARVTSVDAMVDWVPDICELDRFDPARVSVDKVDAWRRAAAGLPATLIVGNSYHVPSERHDSVLSGATVLLIDGNHRGAVVRMDYDLYARFMEPVHYVAWDDAGIGDVRSAADAVLASLRVAGADVEERGFGDLRVWRVSTASSRQIP